MTVEEAIKFGNMWLDMNQDAKDSDTYQFFVIALKALGLTKSGLLKDCESCKAELPCTDAISRKYIQKKYITYMLHPDADIVMEWVDEAPPVRVAEKVGYWIDTGSGQECSECHEIQYGYDNHRFYCPNCGCRMVEPQESEDKE